PFQGATPLEILEQVATLDPVPPRQLQPSIPRDLETICLKCLRKDPHKRYASAQALADELGRFLDGRPIVGRPVSTVERLAKWVRRRPAAASLVGVAAVALAASVGVLVSLDYSRRLVLAGLELQNTLEQRDELIYFNQITLADIAWRDSEISRA